MILQLTLDLATPEECVAGPPRYRQPLRKFRELAILTNMITSTDDMGVLRQACFARGLNKAGWRFLNRYDEDAYAAVMPIPSAGIPG